MFRLIKSMLYRATHDVFFYIAALLCVAITIYFVNASGSELVNHTRSQYDQNVIVNYGEEDALNVSKHLIFGDIVIHNVPGHDIVYRDSLNNVSATEYLVVTISIFVLVISLLYTIVFYGEMFSKGAIRNMITAGLTKRRAFIASVIVNTILLVTFALLSGVAAAIFVLAAGFYPLIYIPSFLVFLLAELLIGTLAGTFVILIVFITQRPLKSILVVIACVVVFAVVSSSVDVTTAFDFKYDTDSEVFFKFIEDSKKHDSGFEWYMPVNDFNLFAVYKEDGTLYMDFSSDEPNQYYSGDTRVAIARIFWRLNVGLLPLEVVEFHLYPIYRDGVLLRYIAVSSVYEIILLAAGCAIVKKRNIN